MTLTDEQLAAIEKRPDFLQEAARYFRKRPTGGEDRAHWANVYNAENCEKMAVEFRALLDEVTALRHDITRHMEIANEHLAEVERLESHITAARSFRVLNENEQADRHLSEAME